MKIEIVTDLEQIKRLAKKKEEENWGFRSFLKSGIFPPSQIDKMALSLYKKIVTRINCKTCGNCCQKLPFQVLDTDIEKLANRLNLKHDQVIKQYLKPSQEEKEKYETKAIPCPFLKGTTCSVYQDRPIDCISYPHINKRSLVSRLISVIHNCEICPIVFNLYEAMKAEIWSMDDEMDDDELDQMVEEDLV